MKYTGLRADRIQCPRLARRQSTICFRQVRGTNLSGPVTRIAQRQDSDSFSQAAASGDQRGAGAAGTDAGSATRPGPDYPWPSIPHSRRTRINPSWPPDLQTEGKMMWRVFAPNPVHLRSIIYDPNSLQIPDLEEVPRCLSLIFFSPGLLHATGKKSTSL